MRRRIASTSAALVVVALALAGCASTDAGSSHEGHGSEPSAESTSGASAADVMFAAMMIPHHEQAVEMADIVLAKPGLDARVADLATRIRDAQAPEIATMEGWLEAWGEDADAHEGMQHGGDDGMLSDDELAALEAADGPEASRLFLEGMIAHHEGAVTMAEQQLADGSDPDALALAASIVETQQAEIDEMQGLLAEL